VTLSGKVRFTASPTLAGGGKARLRGTAEPRSTVDIYAKPSGLDHSTKIASVVANDEGNWGLGTTIVATTRFRARTGGARTSVLTTVVRSNQTVDADALGQGRVRFTVRGVPNVQGVVTIYDGHVRLAHTVTDGHGDVTTLVQFSPGRRTFRIYFAAPGTTRTGRSLTGTVR
jgi:hypothetical protein